MIPDGSKSPSCPLCGSVQTRLAFVKDSVPSFDCGVCGFRFSRPAKNANLKEDINEYEAAFLSYLGESEESLVNCRFLKKWVEKSGCMAGERILDIGCGGGGWVRFLRSEGADAIGIEPVEPLFKRFLQKDAFFRNAWIEEVAAEGERYDTVTLLYVIEHVEQPVPFLDALAGLVRPGGRLLVSTPDLGSPHARLFGRYWHFYYPYHLSFFTRQTLARELEARGFHEVAFARHGRRRSLGYVFRYLFEFILGMKKAPAPRFLDKICLPINLHDTLYAIYRKEAAGNQT